MQVCEVKILSFLQTKKILMSYKYNFITYFKGLNPAQSI